MNRIRMLMVPVVGLVKVHWIALCIVAGAILLYALAGFFLVPHVGRVQLTKYVTQSLHRQVSLGELKFNPFTLQAEARDFNLTEADGAPLVRFRYLLVNAGLASIWQRAISLQEVQLDSPDVQLVIAQDGSVNLAQLAPPADEPPPEEESPPPRVRIGRFAVTGGRVGLEDRTHEKPFIAAATPIRFTLTDFRTEAGYENAYDFSGTTLSGEKLQWSGAFTVQPLGSTGRFRVEGLKAETIDSYLYESLPFQFVSGNLTLNGGYQFALEPFALDVSLPSIMVRDLQLAQRGQDPKPITVPELEVQDVAFSYGKRNVGLKLVDIRNARVDVAREEDGSISLARLFGMTDVSGGQPDAERAPDQSTAPSAQQPSSWLVHIDTIHLDKAAITAEDRAVSPAVKFELTPLNLTLRRWSTDPSAKLQLDADVTINKDGKLLGKGELQLEPLSAQLAVDLTGFALPVTQPYLDRATSMTLHSGKLSAKGDVSYAATPESAPPLKFTGELQIADLRTTDQLVNEDFVKWRNLTVSGLNYAQNPDRLTIDRIVARQPYAKVVIAEDTSLNVARVLRIESEAAEGEASDETAASPRRRGSSDQRNGSSSPSFPILIKRVQFIDGSANFADYSIEPSFASGILGLNGAVVGLSTDPASRAQVKLGGKVDRYAPVDITGEVNLLSAAKYTDLSMDFRNMELTTFNPYSGKFAGYNISKGKLSTELKYKVEDRALNAAHHIVLDNLEFGAKTDSKDAAPIPMKLAVALLKDRNGVIDVNLPVNGTLDDPAFRLGPLIWKAVLGLLTKAVTAPFAALGALFGSGDELAYVEFPAGSAVFPATETEKLNKLARALIERPQLKLSIPLTVVTAQDSDALARAALTTRLAPDANEPPADDSAKRKRLAALEKTYRDLVKAAPEYPPDTRTGKGADLDAQLQFLDQALLEKLRPDDAALTALAQQRARAVQGTLLANTELSPERVFITAEKVEGKSTADEVRMEMKLE